METGELYTFYVTGIYHRIDMATKLKMYITLPHSVLKYTRDDGV